MRLWVQSVDASVIYHGKGVGSRIETTRKGFVKYESQITKMVRN